MKNKSWLNKKQSTMKDSQTKQVEVKDVEQAAKDWALKIADENEEVVRPMKQFIVHKWVKDSFIAGSQWQANRSKEDFNDIANGREPTPVKGDDAEWKEKFGEWYLEVAYKTPVPLVMLIDHIERYIIGSTDKNETKD